MTSNPHIDELATVAQSLVADGKGILAADESNGTIAKRLKGIGVESTETARRDYRETLFTTPDLEKNVAGVILYDETIRQKGANGTRLAEALAAKGIHPGIKVDTGAKPLALHPDEKVTEGLDGLRERLQEYKALGATFAKWRAVITIKGDAMPSQACIDVNAHALARYAALCQEAGIVPIVEPEVLMDGTHTVDRCEEVTSRVWQRTFEELANQGVAFEGMLLKPAMIVAGKDCPKQASVKEVAERTVRLMKEFVPAAVPGIVFLSGGQSPELATEHLQAMNEIGSLPWKLSFSYGRALQEPALNAWGGDNANRPKAQAALGLRARLNGAASQGHYKKEMEPQAA